MYIPIADSLASSINSVIQRGMPTVLSVVLHTVRHPQQIPPQHKVHIYTEYHIVCSLVGFGTLPPLLSPASVPLPSEPKGGAHSPAGEGVGESQFRRLEKKLSTLPTLCSWPVSSSLPLISCFLPPPFRFYIFFMLNLKYRSSNLGYPPIFFTYRKHRFIELAIRQIPKNLNLSKSNNRKKFVEPSTSNHEKNIGCPPLHDEYLSLDCWVIYQKYASDIHYFFFIWFELFSKLELSKLHYFVRELRNQLWNFESFIEKLS
jgi:hypothetical protein